MNLPRVWSGLFALLLLLFIGAGVASVALPEETEHAGYYDGDDDDAGAVPERITTLVNLAVTAAPTALPVQNPGTPPVPAEPVSPAPPGRSDPPALRSPPPA